MAVICSNPKCKKQITEKAVALAVADGARVFCSTDCMVEVLKDSKDSAWSIVQKAVQQGRKVFA